MDTIHLRPALPADAIAASLLAYLGKDRAGDLVKALLARIDALDGDPDREEDNEDCCVASDDAGTCAVVRGSNDALPGDPDDAEEGHDVEAAERVYADDQRLVRYAHGSAALNIDTMRDQAVQL